MIKMVYCVKRREDVTPEKFRNYWLNEHGPRVKRNAAAVRMKKYVQSHGIQTPLHLTALQNVGGTPWTT